MALVAPSREYLGRVFLFLEQNKSLFGPENAHKKSVFSGPFFIFLYIDVSVEKCLYFWVKCDKI